MENFKKGENGECLDILFVIVLYKLVLEDAATYISLAKAVAVAKCEIDLLVYDNGSGEFKPDFKREPGINVIYVSDSENSGVSKAYNTGANLAKEMKKKWLFLLDQDTQLPPQTIIQYLKSITSFPAEELFAPIMRVNNSKIISPCHFKFMRGIAVKHIAIGLNTLNKYSLINCGICVKVDAFCKNEGYNELLKLDFSDHDFIRRFRKNVTDKFIVVDLTVEHQLSSESVNDVKSDKIRFNYYLAAGKLLGTNWIENFFIKINAIAHALKLSIYHKTFYFVLRLLVFEQ